MYKSFFELGINLAMSWPALRRFESTKYAPLIEPKKQMWHKIEKNNNKLMPCNKKSVTTLRMWENWTEFVR